MGICPKCGEPRLGAFRFCRRCGLDFDAPSAPPPAPGPDAALGPRPRRRGLARIAVVGVAALLGVGALADAMGGPTPQPTSTSVAAPATSTVLTTPGPATPGPATPTAAVFTPTGPTQAATVVRVTDGDTIVVAIDGVEARVRYIGMDTPEPDATDPAVRAMADQATAANVALVEGREVILERDVSETDRFDRLLRNVWVANADGALSMVGLELVRQGFAQVSTYPPDLRYVDLLLEVQEDARTREVGLWAPTPAPTAASSAQTSGIDTLTLVGTADRTRFEGTTGASA